MNRITGRGLIRRQVKDVDGFIAVSDYCVPAMTKLLQIPPKRIAVVAGSTDQPTTAWRTQSGHKRRLRVGYFARVAPEKGLHVLAEAYRLFRARTSDAPARLEAAGYLAHEHVGYLGEVRRGPDAAGADDVHAQALFHVLDRQ